MSDPKFPVERPDLTRLPWRALAIVAKVIESGDRKYQAGDWIMAPQRVDGRRDLASALRHIGEFVEGQDVDEDSGESPLAHAAARLLFLLEREARGIKGGGWRIGQPKPGEIVMQAPEPRRSFRERFGGWFAEHVGQSFTFDVEEWPPGRIEPLPRTPGPCGVGGFTGAGEVALCGLDHGHAAPHIFTVPDITGTRPKSPSGEAWDPIADSGKIAREINRAPCAFIQRAPSGRWFVCELESGHAADHLYTIPFSSTE